MKKFAIGIVGFAMLVALVAPRGGNSALGDEAAADGQELDAWEQAALEAREGRSPGSRRPAAPRPGSFEKPWVPRSARSNPIEFSSVVPS